MTLNGWGGHPKLRSGLLWGEATTVVTGNRARKLGGVGVAQGIRTGEGRNELQKKDGEA